MARAKGKSKKTNTRSKAKGPSAKAKTPSASSKLAAAMKSLNNNRTPIHTLLPMEKGPAFRTGSKKGARHSRGFAGPHKLLLSVEKPGKQPKAPKSVANPVAKQQTQFGLNQQILKSGIFKGQPLTKPHAAELNKQNKQLEQEILAAQKSFAGIQYQNYLTAEKLYQQELADWDTQNTEYKAAEAQNTQHLKDYKHDINKLRSRRVKPTRHKITSRGAVSHGRSSKGSR